MMIKWISTTLIIWNWNGDQGDLLYLNLDLELLFTKSQNFKLDFNW